MLFKRALYDHVFNIFSYVPFKGILLNLACFILFLNASDQLSFVLVLSA